jgi:hypothetical protein
VPAQQRLRRDEQTVAACGGPPSPLIAASSARSLGRSALTTQNLELMTQHEQLDVLTSTRRPLRINKFSSDKKAR